MDGRLHGAYQDLTARAGVFRERGSTGRSQRARCLLAAIAVALPLVSGSAVARGIATDSRQSLSGVNVLGWGFTDPHAVTPDGSHLWVANDNSVTELNATDGSFMATIAGPGYQFLNPRAIAADGAHVWVLSADGSVTELTESGTLVAVIRGPSYQFYEPDAIASDGADVWVTSIKPSFQSAGGVTEISATTGDFVRFIPLVDESPSDVTVAGGHVWVACNPGGSGADYSLTAIDPATGAIQRVLTDPKYGFQGGVGTIAAYGLALWVAGVSSVTEVNASTGARVGVISGFTHRFRHNSGLAVDSSHVWISGSWGFDYLTELDASTGKLVRVISGSRFSFHDPGSVASDGSHVWIASAGTNVVTVINAATGRLTTVLRGSAYRFSRPSAITIAAGKVWVANYTGNSITEVDATTGALTHLFKGSSKYHFLAPSAIAADGSHVWTFGATPHRADYLVELNASTGKLVRTISIPSSTYPRAEFGSPGGGNEAIATDGMRVWATAVLTAGGRSAVAEVNATTGKLINVFSASSYKFKSVTGIALSGGAVWIANAVGRSVTELNGSTGHMVRVISGSTFGFAAPVSAIAADGSDVWVASGNNPNSSNLTELSTSDGKLIRVITGASGGFAGPQAVAIAAPNVWVPNFMNEDCACNLDLIDSTSKVDSQTGAVQIVSGPQYQFEWPDAVASDGTNIWVANANGDSVTEFSSS